jgi:hypothetical protein
MCDFQINIHSDGKVSAECPTHAYGWGTQLIDELYPRLMQHMVDNGIVRLSYKAVSNI